MIQVLRISMLTGKKHIRYLANATPEQLNAWKNGVLIQKAFPDLSPEDREFIMTGITPEEWDIYMRWEDNNEHV